MKDLHRAAPVAAAPQAERPAHLNRPVHPLLAAAAASLLVACAQNPSAPQASETAKPASAPASTSAGAPALVEAGADAGLAVSEACGALGFCAQATRRLAAAAANKGCTGRLRWAGRSA